MCGRCWVTRAERRHWTTLPIVRVYVPATLAMLQRLVADGEIFPVGGTAFAVTPTLREAYSDGDDEELAEVALREAALASLRLIATGGAGDLPLRRAVVVAAAEVIPLLVEQLIECFQECENLHS